MTRVRTGYIASAASRALAVIPLGEHFRVSVKDVCVAYGMKFASHELVEIPYSAARHMTRTPS